MEDTINCIVSTKNLYERINCAIPEAKFCAKYARTEKDLMLNLRQYQKQSFVYLLTSNYMDKKCIIYVGKSYDQCNRIAMHKANYEFDELFLFAVSEKKQKVVEDRMIELFSPLYNKTRNLEQAREMEMIGLQYDEYKSCERIQEDIQLLMNNHKMQPVTFFLPRKYVYAIREQAEQREISCNQLLSEILENELPKDILMQSVRNCNEEDEITTEMVTVQEYAKMWGRSVEQIKVHCRNGRLFAYKQGRDWLIPRSAPYPIDRRRK